MIDFKEWYYKYGHKIEDEIQNWYDSCPSSFIDIEDLPYIMDILEDEYESYIGDIEDRAYDEYKDSLWEE